MHYNTLKFSNFILIFKKLLDLKYTILNYKIFPKQLQEFDTKNLEYIPKKLGVKFWFSTFQIVWKFKFLLDIVRFQCGKSSILVSTTNPMSFLFFLDTPK